ncbi:MAG: hypothetical protein WCS51_05555 [Bacilli bacterium]
MEIFINKKRYFAFVDLGFDDDLSVEVRVKKMLDGSIKILADDVIGRNIGMNEMDEQLIFNRCKIDIT